MSVPSAGVWDRRAWAAGIVFGFGLGGVLDLIGFVLFLLFVLLSSAISIRDEGPARAAEARSA
jgi:hypothetical protein